MSKIADALASRLEKAKLRTRTLTPEMAMRWVNGGAVLIDVREDYELADGTAAGAHHVPRGLLESRVVELVPDPKQDIVLMCEAGTRSLLAATSLYELGYFRVGHVEGGFPAWREANLPVTRLDSEPVGAGSLRYARQLVLPEVGEPGQRKIKQARVLVVGAGGLGSPVALYLAAAGVGHLGIIDDDRVERSNLQRQVLHADHLVGHLKTDSAAARLHELNPHVQVTTFAERLNSGNARRLLSGWDIVVDGVDNFSTRNIINETCIRLKVPMVYGAVLRFAGQVSVFNSNLGESPCYRCLFPVAPGPESAPSCAEAGVLGVMPGIVGCLQATEVLKLILGIGKTLEGRLLQIDALGLTFRDSPMRLDPKCPACSDGRAAALHYERQEKLSS